LILLLFLVFGPALSTADEGDIAKIPLKKNQLKTIIVESYYPYTYVNEDGVPDGFSIDLAKAVTKIMGMELKVSVDTWERARAALENGEIDLLPMMAYSEKRDTIFDFSVPHTIAYDAFFTRIDSKKISSVVDLSGKKVIVMKNDQAHDYLRSVKNVAPENLILIDGLPKALRLLASGKGDVALMPKLVGLIAKMDLNLTNLSKNPAIIEDYNRPFGFAVKEGNKLLLERLSQGLSIVKKSGQYDEIYEKWFAAIDPKELTLKSALKYIAGLFLALFAIGSALALWSFSLRKQVAVRTRNLEDEIIERKQAEMRFRQVTDAIREVFWLGSADWKQIYYISPGYEEVWGKSCEDLYKHPMSWFESLVEEDRPKIMACIRDKIGNDIGVIQFPDYRVRRPDGSIAWVSARAFPVMDSSGRPYRIAGIAENITERKQTEEALRTSHERFLTVLNSIDATVYVSDMETHEILFMNEFMIKSFGRDMTGEICWAVFRGESETCPHCNNNQLIDENGKSTGVCVWQGKNPITDKWYINYDRAIEWTDGQLVKLQIATDITTLKGMEEELRQAHKMEAVGTLAGGIAHDFNNILGIIIGNTELALDDIPEWNPARTNLSEIKIASLRAKDVVRQLLSFSRKSEQQRRAVNITPIINESLQLIRASIPSTIEIRSDITTDPALIMADPTQIQQVIINLCTNATQAMEQKGGILAVNLTSVELNGESWGMDNGIVAGRHIQVTVSDTGEGVNSEIKDKIFDPYFTTKEVGQGSGMGLAIVHGIVKNHDGAIAIDSESGKGTTITVVFPVCREEYVEEKSELDELPTGDERILHVDDEKSIVKMTEQLLARLGYHVHSRMNPIEALELFQTKPDHFDLVITDMTMPQMTGVQLAEKIIDIRKDIPIIITTGYSSQIDDEKARAMGIAAYVMKPIVKQEFAVSIRRVLDHIESSGK